MNQQPASVDAQPTGLSALSVAQWFYERPVFWLSIIGVLGLVALLTFQFFSSRELIEDSALESAKLYSEALSEFRTIYTSEVVETVRAQGIAVTHDYDELEHAIPLPATLSMILGERIGQHSSGAKTNLYSAYPFPWRRVENRKLFDDPFLKEAWDELTRNPEKPFFTFTELTGRPVLRYATADLMRAACVNCHNTHPETPKSDWKDGDVRGVLLVDLPLERASLQAQAAMRRTGVLSLFLAALWISGLVLVIGKLRRISTELKVRVSKRTEELACSNEELERLLSRFQESEARMRKLAHYDSLTGLPNRRLFQLQMARTLELAMRRGSKLALLFLDLDRFKEVNDTFGHSVGDELLSQVAERLLKTIRHRDAVGHSDSADSEPMLCRLGGDEFTILLSRILDAQDAAKVAQRLLNTLSEPFSIAGHEVYADASVGIVVFPDDGENPETLPAN